MKGIKILALVVSLVLLLSAAALAAGTEFTMRFNSAVNLGTTTLKPGEYRIVVQDDSTKPAVIFYAGRREVARVEGTWSALDTPATRDCVAMRKDEKGNLAVSRVLLRGSNKAVQVADITAQVK